MTFRSLDDSLLEKTFSIICFVLFSNECLLIVQTFVFGSQLRNRVSVRVKQLPIKLSHVFISRGF